MTTKLDPRETRSQDEREAALIQALQNCFAEASKNSAHYTQSLAAPPFGGLGTQAPDAMARLFLSPGPIAEPQGNYARRVTSRVTSPITAFPIT